MYLYSIPYKDNIHIIYRPLIKLAFLANTAMVNLIYEYSFKSNNQFEKEHKYSYQFLNNIGYFKPDPYMELNNPPLHKFLPDTVVLCLTTRCNFRCVYCYASAGEKKIKDLNPETGFKAIDFVYSSAIKKNKDHFNLCFHGSGEPLMNFDLLKTMVEYARSKDLPVRASIATNGYINTTDRFWLLDNIDEISISLDGISRIQDNLRPLSSGKGSFDNVFQTIKMMDEKNTQYGIRMTITDSSIQYLPESIQYLCKNTSCTTFQIEPAFSNGRAIKNKQALTKFSGFVKAFVKAYRIASKNNRHLYYSGARPWLITDSFCKAGERALIVTPDDELTTCYEVSSNDHFLKNQFFFGNINKKVSIDHKKRNHFFKKIEQRRNICRSCFNYWHCAGDCPAKTFSNIRNGHLKIKKRCDLNRAVTKAMIIESIVSGNNLFLQQ